uniref:Uncharacterized protein n=1 Tax=Noccaea caerulescens TaxID=107243 RepID=A0A1J3CT44_NOCCA
MKKTTKAFLLLSLLHILLCLSFQVHVTQARLRHLGKAAMTLICTRPPPPCGDSPKASGATGSNDKPCKTIPRPPPPPRCS